MNFIGHKRFITLLFILLIVPLGFLTKLCYGPAGDWIRDSLGGLLYEIFWCLVLFFIFSKVQPVILALVVLISTCLLEFLQMWHPIFLENLRSNFIGRTILGNTFNLMDFPYYFLGSTLGYLILKFITRVSKTTP